jgi:hypothetical protein
MAKRRHPDHHALLKAHATEGERLNGREHRRRLVIFSLVVLTLLPIGHQAIGSPIGEPCETLGIQTVLSTVEPPLRSAIDQIWQVIFPASTPPPMPDPCPLFVRYSVSTYAEGFPSQTRVCTDVVAESHTTFGVALQVSGLAISNGVDPPFVWPRQPLFDAPSQQFVDSGHLCTASQWDLSGLDGAVVATVQVTSTPTRVEDKLTVSDPDVTLHCWNFSDESIVQTC